MRTPLATVALFVAILFTAVAVPSAALPGSAVPVAARPSPLVAATPGKVEYGLPVGGAILDPYRAPSTPYGPGNRGVVLATTAGAPVGAPADGIVTFAGQVGGDLFVVIQHGDGVRTTLGYLASILVAAGQRVHGGQWVARSKTSVHFGARIGANYIDPMSLLAPQIPKVWLIRSSG